MHQLAKRQTFILLLLTCLHAAALRLVVAWLRLGWDWGSNNLGTTFVSLCGMFSRDHLFLSPYWVWYPPKLFIARSGIPPWAYALAYPVGDYSVVLTKLLVLLGTNTAAVSKTIGWLCAHYTKLLLFLKWCDLLWHILQITKRLLSFCTFSLELFILCC